MAGGRHRGSRAAGRHRSSRATDRLRGRAVEGPLAVAKTRRSQLRFALTFIALGAVFFTLYSFPYKENGISERWFERYLSAYAHLAGFVLGVFDRNVGVTGNVIAGRFSLHIVKTCDAMEANLLFVAAIAALPAPWKRKVVAGIAGVAILVVVNVVRICSLYAAGVYVPSAFEFLHVELWPLLIIGAALAEFIGWAIWMQRPRVATASAVATVPEGT